MKSRNIQIKRAYEAPAKSDGFRILVDRLWPRGVSKEDLDADLWAKDVAPSTELRKWFDHDPDKWQAFKKRYFNELDENTEAVQQIRNHLKKNQVTLVFGAKDEKHNQAVALKAYLEGQGD